MCNIVTERLIHCINALKEKNKIKSIRQLALSVDYHPQNLNDLMKGKRDATVDLIRVVVDKYNINPHYLFTGSGTMFIEDTAENTSSCKIHDSIEKILYVPTAAHAGYIDQFNDPVYQEDLVSFSLPDYKFQHGIYRCFDIVGDSMEPSLFAGDKVVCSFIDSNNLFSSVRNNFVYVVVTDGGIVVKRVINKIRENNSLELMSDNGFYPSYDIPLSEVREIWHVEVKISPYLPSPNNIRNTFHEEMDEMRQTINQQSRSIQVLNQTVEKLLRQNRPVY